MTPELVLYEKLKYHVKVGPDGRRSYYNGAGQLHRDDGPAIIDSDGVEYWFQNDKQHRVGGPAIVHPCGTEFWLQHALLHREDGPAVIWFSGSKEWYLYGVSYPEGVYLAKIAAIKSKNAH